MAKNEIVKAGSFNLVSIGGSLAQAVEEELDGLGTLSFDRVKIPAGGGIAFELPGEDEDSPESSPEITGVILDHHAVNVYWRDKFSGGNAQPDCSSTDGKTGIDRMTGEVRTCASCPANQFGSDPSNGRGKACKNVHRLYILKNGSPVPIVLALPPTSLKSLRDYLGKKIILKGLRSYEAITRITLKKETSADGVVYSRAVFSFQDALNGDQRAAAQEMRAVVRSTRQQIDIAEDFTQAAPASAPMGTQTAQPPAVGPDGFMDIPDGIEEELPFN